MTGIPNKSTTDLPELHLQLLKAAAPERAAELAQLVEAANVEIVPASDRQGFQLGTAFGAIVVGHRSPAASWLVSCAAWNCVTAYSPALLLTDKLSSRDIAAMPGQAEHVAKVAQCLSAARALLALHDTETFMWPDGVPAPEQSSTSKSDEFAQDIAHIAWAFMLLHEIKHAQLWATGAQPENLIEEERICDAFAVDHLLDDVDRYAAENGKPSELVRDLRAMGVVTGLFLVAILGHDTSSSHPPSQERFDLLLRRMDGHPVKWFVLYAAALLLGALDMRQRPIDLRNFTSDCTGLSALTALL